MKQHMKLLGYRVKDVVTGLEGFAESICFDLYGCVQVLVKPSVTKEKTIGNS